MRLMKPESDRHSVVVDLEGAASSRVTHAVSSPPDYHSIQASVLDADQAARAHQTCPHDGEKPKPTNSTRHLFTRLAAAKSIRNKNYRRFTRNLMKRELCLFTLRLQKEGLPQLIQSRWNTC